MAYVNKTIVIMLNILMYKLFITEAVKLKQTIKLAYCIIL